MEDIKNLKCKPCENYGKALDSVEANNWLQKIPEWKLDFDENTINRRFKFKDFYRTMEFVNAVAWIANQQNHHPTIRIGYNYCQISFTTHALNGLSPNDFICALKVDELLK